MREDITLRDRHKQAFKSLVSTGIQQVLRGNTQTVLDNYYIEFEPFPINTGSPLRDNNTIYTVVKTKVRVTNQTTQDSIEFIIDVLNLPVYQEQGFYIRGNFMQVLDMYKRTPGWGFTKVNTADGLVYAGTLNTVGERQMSFRYAKKEAIEVRFTAGSSGTPVSAAVFFKALSGKTDSDLIEMFGRNNAYVIQTFSNNKKATKEGSKISDKTISRASAIEYLWNACSTPKGASKSKTTQNMLKDIENSIMSTKYFDLGNGNLPRLDMLQSFKHRALGKVLAKDIVVGKTSIKEGTILNEEILTKLDNMNINMLPVAHSNKVYELKKFSTFTFRGLNMILDEDIPTVEFSKGRKLSLEDLKVLNESKLYSIKVKDVDGKQLSLVRRIYARTLALEDLYTAFGIFLDNLNGYDSYDKSYELTNRISEQYDKKVLEMLDDNVKSIVDEITTRLETLDESESLIHLVSQASKGIKKNSFIEAISINAENMSSEDLESQRSDMTNIVANLTKSYKAVSDIPTNASTAETISVQGSQLGRLDSLDSPESAKIGLTHTRTVLSKVDENKSLLAPYLVVKDGEVVSDEPVYLTPAQEHGKYIAEWNETFLEEDAHGNLVKKLRVRVKHDADIITVPINEVAYKQYSYIQDLSPSRCSIPFQDRCMPKRLLMACNHLGQALVSLKGERPLVGAGGESLFGIGRYVTREVLEDFYKDNSVLYPDMVKYKEEIINSSIRLIEILNENTERVFIFEVDYLVDLKSKNVPVQCELAVPLHLPNDEKTMFSFIINTTQGVKFQGDDIVAHYMGYDVKKYNVLKHTDFGGLKVEDKVFDTGTSSGVNLFCVVKTHKGSTIDDAIVISDRLVSEDILSSIAIIKVERELFNTSTEKEKFGRIVTGSKVLNKAHPHIGINGLPAVGTILKPGDAYCSIVVTKNNTVKNKFIYLDTYQEGQVYRSYIENVDGKDTLVLYLAYRTPAEVGDKMAGRFGNKGVIARVVKEQDMAYDPVTGKRADIILTPLGIPSRMNTGIVLEISMAMAVKKSGDNNICVITPYSGKDTEFVNEMILKHDVKPIPMIDGQTGKYYERPVNAGYIYMFMLVHKVNKKIHSVGLNVPLDPVMLQPKKGAKKNGGQSFGEMESWCLHALNAPNMAQGLYSTHSDDNENGRKIAEMLKQNPHSLSIRGTNNNDLHLQAVLRCMGMDITTDLDSDSYSFVPITDETIRRLAIRPITSDKELHSMEIFGNNSSNEEREKNRDKWGWIDLGTKIVHPSWFRKASLGKLLTNYQYVYRFGDPEELAIESTNTIYEDILKGNFYVDTGYTNRATRNKVATIESDADEFVTTVKLYASSNTFINGRKTKKNTNLMDISLQEEELYTKLSDARPSKYSNEQDNDQDENEYDVDGVDDEDYIDDYYEDVTVSGTDKGPKYDCILEQSEDVKARCLTGMPALVWILENYNVQDTLDILLKRKERKLEKTYDIMGDLATYDDESYIKLLKTIGTLESFVENKRSLKEFIISSFPVIPEIYRTDMSDTGLKDIADFDWYYTAILNEVNKYKITPSIANAYNIYIAIALYCGIGSREEMPKKHKYKNLLNWFTGKNEDDNKGKLRVALQSKKIKVSGRTVIIPTENINWHPTVLGVPYSMCLKMYSAGIIGYLCEKITEGENKHDHKEIYNLKDPIWASIFTSLATYNKVTFSKLYKRHLRDYGQRIVDLQNADRAYHTINNWIEDYINGNAELGLNPQVCICGRQPSLHQFSIRGYYVRIVHHKCIHIHALVCKGYNADFDGDQMWVAAALTDEEKEEVMRVMSARTSYINPKNSSVILEISQDIVLGLYNATMLKDNAISISDNIIETVQHYNSVARMYTDIELMELHTYDLVCYRHTNGNNYLSTAGRVVLNSLIPNGFTDNEFSNTLNIQGIKSTCYKELRVDALLSSGSCDNKEIRYYKISNLMKEIYTEVNNDAIDYYQNLTRYGFICADIHAVSLGLSDFKLESYRDQILAGAEVTKRKIEKCYLDGLCSEESRRQALIDLYSKDLSDKKLVNEIYRSVAVIEDRFTNKEIDKYERNILLTEEFSKLKDGINQLVKKEVVRALHRNNNMFIMMDSGARGSESQIMIACGSIGVLQKSATETLETCVTTNYIKGISSFDCYLISFSTRTAVASTQNETQKAGEATRNAVYIASGLTIVEEDCGKEDVWYKVQWANRIESYDLLKPSERFVNSRLVGTKPDMTHEPTAKLLGNCLDKDGKVTINALESLKDGFKELRVFRDDKLDRVIVDPDTMLGSKLLDQDLVYKTSKLVSKKGIVNTRVIKYLLKIHSKSIQTSLGVFEFRYEIDKACESLLLYREAFGLPYLETKLSKKYKRDVSFITPKTLKYITQQGLEVINVRVFLDCMSHKGVCARCYGVEYTTKELPAIGKNIGVEAAQSVGEPAAQLTMNVTHTMGQAGTGVQSGVQIFSSALNGKRLGEHALLSPVSGFVNITKLDSMIALQIDVPTLDNDDCRRCMLAAETETCPIEYNKIAVIKNETLKSSSCKINYKINRKALAVQNGEWVNKGDSLTEAGINPDDIVAVDGETSDKYVIRRKQQVWLSFYYHTFSKSNVDINARHFECLARVQNFLVTVVSSTDPNFKEGFTYEYSEVKDNPNVKFSSKLSSKSEVLLNYGGPFTLITHSDFARYVTKLGKQGYKFKRNSVKSQVGKLTAGEAMDRDEIKSFRTVTLEVANTENGFNNLSRFNNIPLPVEIQTSSGDNELRDIVFDFSDDLLENMLDDAPDIITVQTNKPELKEVNAFNKDVEITQEEEEEFYNEVEELEVEIVQEVKPIIAPAPASLKSVKSF